MDTHTSLEAILRAIRPADAAALEAARKRQHALVKPAGSLGELENIAIRVAGVTGRVENHAERRRLLLFGADNGVYAEGVSGTPQSYTRALMELYAGRGGCINALCRSADVELRLFDLGVIDLPPTAGVDASHKLMPRGTDNLRRGRAMPRHIAQAAVEYGASLAQAAAEDGCALLGAGEVGMGNTTTAAACIAACLGGGDELVGRGGGLTDAALAKKKRVVTEALALHGLTGGDAEPLEILSCVGGLDIAAMTGVFLGAAAYHIPAVVDGVIAAAAALLAQRFAPASRDYLFPSHCSTEPAYAAAAEALGFTPILNLGMRLGEGSGCPIAMQIIADALDVMNHVPTFADAALDSAYRAPLKADEAGKNSQIVTI